jgi:threonine synthase
MSKMKALVCRECGKEYPTKAIHVCEMCFGPLEVKYNYEEIKKNISRKKIEDGPHSMWRYLDLLPVEGTNFVGPHAGFTPLVRAKNLGAYFGLDELYIKNDTVNHPTLSFKDRVVAIALTRARELGFETVACASTGNLANSVSAHAAAANMAAILRPARSDRTRNSTNATSRQLADSMTPIVFILPSIPA